MKLDGKEGVFCCTFVTSVFSFNDTGLSSLLFPKTVFLNMFSSIQDNNQKVLNYFEILPSFSTMSPYSLSVISPNHIYLGRFLGGFNGWAEKRLSNQIKYEFDCPYKCNVQ